LIVYLYARGWSFSILNRAVERGKDEASQEEDIMKVSFRCIAFIVGCLAASTSTSSGCGGSDNENFMVSTSGMATPEERAKPVRDYPRSQEEYNKNIAPKAPPGSYTRAYPYARGTNRDLLAPAAESESKKSKTAR